MTNQLNARLIKSIHTYLQSALNKLMTAKYPSSAIAMELAWCWRARYEGCGFFLNIFGVSGIPSVCFVTCQPGRLVLVYDQALVLICARGCFPEALVLREERLPR